MDHTYSAAPQQPEAAPIHGPYAMGEHFPLQRARMPSGIHPDDLTQARLRLSPDVLPLRRPPGREAIR